MSLLINLIFASHARSTHHKLALDALRHLKGGDTARWTNVIISEHNAYLTGAKAPDDDFKDFKNHVLHVREKFWGGAVTASKQWYGQFVDQLRAEDWKNAAYSAGVLSHYYTDPHMPFHTGQTESEGSVHRAAEWTVTKSYDHLRDIIEKDIGGYPTVDVPTSGDWLGDMVKAGAVMANPHYEMLIDHYNLAVGVKNPPAGFDRAAQEVIAKCLAHATIGFARILERGFAEAAVTPPVMNPTPESVLATINVPIRQVLNKLADSKDRQTVEAIYKEVQQTGKAVQSLPDSEKLVRQFHATEVLKMPLSLLNKEKPKPAGRKFSGPPPEPAPSKVDPLVSAAIAKAISSKSGPDFSKLAVAAIVPAVLPAVAALAPKLALPQVAPNVKPEKPVATTQAAEKLVAESPFVAKPVAQTPPVATADMKKPESPETVSARATVLSQASASRTKAPKFYLTLDAPIVDAPSIGPKTATRFNEIGMLTIADLLQAEVTETAKKLETRHITADLLRDWQAQSNLMVTVPGLRGHDAQLLVAANVRDRATLSKSQVASLLQAVEIVAQSSQGRSILRDSAAPDLEEVTDWINSANLATAAPSLKAG